MSGINPVLDTLLHQVLGRRAPAPPLPQTGPVQPLVPGEAPPALRSDSRLDPRAVPAAIKQQSEHRPPLPRAPARLEQAPASARIHFSPAARAIADLLARFPAPPSFVQPAGPLLAAAEPTTPAQLAARLRGTVEHSGLFYQAHLARWFRGELPLAALANEPQMQLTRPVLARRLVQQAPEQPAPAAEAGATKAAPVPPRINDTLQGILRHQLEVLAAPVLNWQGEIWPGATLALAWSWLLPAAEQPETETPPDAEQNTDEAPARDWELSLRLDSAGFGTVHARLRERRGALAVRVSCAEESRVMQLKQHADQLHGILILLGFKRARVQVGVLPLTEHDGEKA